MPKVIKETEFRPRRGPGRPIQYDLSNVKLQLGKINVITMPELIKLGFSTKNQNMLHRAREAFRREAQARDLLAARFGIHNDPEGVYVDLTPYQDLRVRRPDVI